MSLPLLGHDPRQQPGRPVSATIEWVPSLSCWCAFGPSTISAILKSSDFVVPDYAEVHRMLEQRVGIDCSALIRIFELSPTSNEGARRPAPIWRGCCLPTSMQRSSGLQWSFEAWSRYSGVRGRGWILSDSSVGRAQRVHTTKMMCRPRRFSISISDLIAGGNQREGGSHARSLRREREP
jgi:hypothetical protein